MHTTARNIPAVLPSLSDQWGHCTFLSLEDLCISQAPILPSVHSPVSSRTKGCCCQQLSCQQLKAEVAGTGKINHLSNCSSPLYFGDGPLMPSSHMYRHIMEKQHSPTHQLLEQLIHPTAHCMGAPIQILGKMFPRSTYELALPFGQAIVRPWDVSWAPLPVTIFASFCLLKVASEVSFSPATQTLSEQHEFSLFWG